MALYPSINAARRAYAAAPAPSPFQFPHEGTADNTGNATGVTAVYGPSLDVTIPSGAAQAEPGDGWYATWPVLDSAGTAVLNLGDRRLYEFFLEITTDPGSGSKLEVCVGFADSDSLDNSYAGIGLSLDDNEARTYRVNSGGAISSSSASNIPATRDPLVGYVHPGYFNASDDLMKLVAARRIKADGEIGSGEGLVRFDDTETDAVALFDRGEVHFFVAIRRTEVTGAAISVSLRAPYTAAAPGIP